MALPDSYTLKPKAIPPYFDAIVGAQAPERFTVKFLENLGFTSTNDRLFIGILKDLGFLNREGTPQSRYFEFLDRSRSKQVLAVGIREAFADLFAVNTTANVLPVKDVKNKLRTLYAGKKTDLVIKNVANTFRALCDYADFTDEAKGTAPAAAPPHSEDTPFVAGISHGDQEITTPPGRQKATSGKISVSALQYHINIVLPDTRDQAVYDAIFRSLREHLE